MTKQHIGKKILATLMAALLITGIFPLPSVEAAGTIPITVSSSKTSVGVGDEVTFTVSLGNTSGMNMQALSFEISLPSGVNYKAGSGKITEAFKTATGWGSFLNFDEGTKLMVSGFGEDYNGAGIDIANFVCTIDEIGSKTITLANVELLDSAVQIIPSTVTAATVTASGAIASVDVAVTAPVSGAIPQTSINSTNYTGTIAWNGNPSTFAPGTVYTATVTLNANSSYQFSDNITVTVNTSLNGSITSKSATQVVFTVAFPATASKNDVSNTITFNGAEYTYDGKAKALSPATTTDNSGGSFTYSYVGVSGTNYPASSTAPTNAGIYDVTATYSSANVMGSKTVRLTINKVKLTISGVKATDREYDGTTAVTLTGGVLAGHISGDEQNVAFNLGKGTTDNANVGNNKPVTTSITLTGTKAGNYTLTQPTGLTATISKKSVSAVGKSMTVNSGKSYTYNLAELLPSGVAASQVNSYSCEEVNGDIIDGTPTINGSSLSFSVLGSAAVNDTATVTIGFTSSNYTISDASLSLKVVAATVSSSSGSSSAGLGTGALLSASVGQGVDNEIIKQLNEGKNPEITVSSNAVSFSGSALSQVQKANKVLKFKNGLITLVLNEGNMAELNAGANTEIAVMLAKAESGLKTDVQQIDKLNEELLKLAFDLGISVGGNRINAFSTPLALQFELSDYNLSDAQKNKLTGIRYLGESDYNQLGGKFVSDDMFETKTSKTSVYGVLLTDSLVDIEMKLNETTYTLNGVANTMDVAPVIIDNRTMVPIRFIAEALGAEVSWEQTTKTVTVTLDGKTINMTVGQPNAGMDVAPVIVNSRTLVPLRYVSESFDSNVIWNASENSINIYR